MKMLKLALIPLILVSFSLAGCGGGSSPTPGPTKKPGKIIVTNTGIDNSQQQKN